MTKVLAIDIGGTFIKYGVVDDHYQLHKQGKVATPYEGIAQFLQTIYEIYVQLKGEIEGIAISAPGTIRVENGVMETAGMLVYLNGFHIVKEVSKVCDDVKVTVENDARCAALCEYVLGAAKGCDTSVSLLFGSGIGGGVIIDGKMMYGKQLLIGEFSALFHNMAYGKYESMASEFSTITTLKRLQKRKQDDTLTGEDMMQLYRKEDADSVEIVNHWLEVIAKWCFNLDCLYNPDCICIGGGISLDPLFYEGIMHYIDKIYETAFVFRKPLVKVCEYHNDANLLGAYLTFIRQNKEQK